MTSNFVVKLIVMWSNFDPHDKQNFAPQTMSAASGTIMMPTSNLMQNTTYKDKDKDNSPGQGLWVIWDQYTLGQCSDARGSSVGSQTNQGIMTQLYL